MRVFILLFNSNVFDRLDFNTMLCSRSLVDYAFSDA